MINLENIYGRESKYQDMILKLGNIELEWSKQVLRKRLVDCLCCLKERIQLNLNKELNYVNKGKRMLMMK